MRAATSAADRRRGDEARMSDGGTLHRATLALLFAGATAATAAAGEHVRIVNEGSPGPLYECDGAGCAPARTDDPSRKNRSRMDFYVLPEGCVELAGAVLRPDAPGVDVECGPPGRTTRYRCEARACRLLGASATGEDGAVRVQSLRLPADCGGRVHELIVLDARGDAPRVYVECDASSGPAGEI